MSSKALQWGWPSCHNKWHAEAQKERKGGARVEVKDLSMDDLEHLIEQKILEILGELDSGLELSPTKRC